MKFSWWAASFLIALTIRVSAEPTGGPGWKKALPGVTYQFPLDHSAHSDFKTEWWYFTGTLHAAGGHQYGYELTFFRQGVLSPAIQMARSGLAAGDRSKFVQNDFKFAHFAISDLTGGRFHFAQKINRGAFGDAGFGLPTGNNASSLSPDASPLAWIDDWTLQPQLDGSWKISATAKTPTPMSIALTVIPAKGPVIEGTDGVSQTADGAGNASCYYSFTRLKTSGTLTVGADKSRPVSGESWFDHEWASDQLAPDQIGWDWFCFQFDDQTEVMLYAMRRRDGTVDPVSSGTWVGADGKTEHLKFGDFKLRPRRNWLSRQTGANYPLSWAVEIPSHRLDFTVESRLDTQELVLPPVSYWEGAIAVDGHRGSQPIMGHGYMELTGYAGVLKGLQSSPDQPASNLRGAPR